MHDVKLARTYLFKKSIPGYFLKNDELKWNRNTFFPLMVLWDLISFSNNTKLTTLKRHCLPFGHPCSFFSNPVPHSTWQTAKIDRCVKHWEKCSLIQEEFVSWSIRLILQFSLLNIDCPNVSIWVKETFFVYFGLTLYNCICLICPQCWKLFNYWLITVDWCQKHIQRAVKTIAPF